MNRLISPILALAVFLGMGYFTRQYYWPAFQASLKESQEQNRREIDKMIKAQPKWRDIKIDASKITMPTKINIQPRPRSRDNRIN